MLTKDYRIPTSLSIAVARVAEMMPRACALPEGIATLTLERQDQDAACYLVLRPTEYLTTCGPWQVRVTPDAMRWTFAGAQVTLTPDGESVFAGSDARARRACCCVKARLPDLRLPAPDFWGWRLDARLVAVTPNQVLIALWTFHSALGDLVRSLEERIKALERMTSAQVTGSEIPPHPLKDRRKKVLELRREGKSLKEIAKEIGETVHIVKADVRWLHQKGYL